jgi:hypothetical protein
MGKFSGCLVVGLVLGTFIAVFTVPFMLTHFGYFGVLPLIIFAALAIILGARLSRVG